MLRRSQALQIYMKPGLKEDDVMLRVWDACKQYDRPQNVFRKMLQAGLIALVEAGDLPDTIIEECGLDMLVERKRIRVARHAGERKQAAAPVPAPYPVYPQPFQHGYPAQPYPVGEPAHYQAPHQAEPRRVEHPVAAPPASAPAAIVPAAQPAPRAEAPRLPDSQPAQGSQANPSPKVDDGSPKRKLGKLM